jgi:DNA-directed RNA polymerase subunit RPC12/RpoP
MNMDDKIVTFQSYYDPMLAHIIRTRLEANGISCFVADENTLGANPIYNQAVGGVKLKIFERDLEKCKQILATEGDLHEQDHFEIDDENNTYVVCPYCGSNNVSNAGESDEKEWPILNSISNLINPFHTQNNWHCNNCQQNFE